MMFWIVSTVLVFAVSVVFSGLLIPQILLIAFRRKLFDVPDERKIHQGVVPRLGGIAFKPVIFFSLSLMLGVCHWRGYSDKLFGLSSELDTIAFSFCSIMMLYILGMADDLIGIRYRAKFVVQVLCGVLMVAGGLWISDFHGLFGIHAVPAWLGYPLTLLSVVFIINAVNLIDGIDGLASGLCSAATIYLGVSLFLTENYFYAMLSFATLGVLFPFFYYNVFGDAKHMKKIFMGDTGSTTIGMVLYILSTRLLQTPLQETVFSEINPFVLSFSALVVPCFDVVRVYLHRVRYHQNPFMPDKNHIHHKLLALGMKQRQAMVTIVSSSIVLTAVNILLSSFISATSILILNIALYSCGNVYITRRIVARS